MDTAHAIGFLVTTPPEREFGGNEDDPTAID
eukprot:CAMPEP_0195014064 /NCGR_PEP_ID=MMETSP0326_2-20130528/15005_1 /TAXON_ID=2866 ORGANISM="Crypthecodinium cohnii, Strain Seligo" /NCGR_SAMPLE_ID=MMETSP0326_2 /ASSEMBLY_ACC=CAM_ASM_000348 /LENGTH=30 /DNA_ID= /DNA_START= /DNA_END= /DNA_ORIENTATION=